MTVPFLNTVNVFVQEQRRRHPGPKAFAVLRQRGLFLVGERGAVEACEAGGGGGQVATQEPRRAAKPRQHLLHERRPPVVKVVINQFLKDTIFTSFFEVQFLQHPCM